MFGLRVPASRWSRERRLYKAYGALWLAPTPASMPPGAQRVPGSFGPLLWASERPFVAPPWGRITLEGLQRFLQRGSAPEPSSVAAAVALGITWGPSAASLWRWRSSGGACSPQSPSVGFFFAVLLSRSSRRGCEIRAEGGNRYLAPAEASGSMPGTGSSPRRRHATPRGSAAALTRVPPHRRPRGCCPVPPLPHRDGASPPPGAVPEWPLPAAREPLRPTEPGPREPRSRSHCPVGRRWTVSAWPGGPAGDTRGRRRRRQHHGGAPAGRGGGWAGRGRGAMGGHPLHWGG